VRHADEKATQIICIQIYSILYPAVYYYIYYHLQPRPTHHYDVSNHIEDLMINFTNEKIKNQRISRYEN